MSTSLFVGIYQEVLRGWPNRWFGFFIALVIASIVTVVVTVLPDQYQSKAKVFINSAVVLEPLIQGLAVEDDAENRVRLLRVLQSTLTNKDNIDRLIKTPGMGFDVSTSASRAQAADMIRRGVTVTEEEQNLFSLDFVDINPVRARNVAHGLLSLFIERNVVDARKELTAAREFLDKQIAEYEVKLRSIESQIAEYQVRNVDALGTSNYQARLAAARTALREAKVAQQMAVEARDRIKKQTVNGQDRKADQSVLLANDKTFPALIDRMAALQAQLNQLLLVYTERHPDVIATRRELAALSAQFDLEDGLSSTAQPFTVIPGQVPPGDAVKSAASEVTPGSQSATSQPAALSQQPGAAPMSNAKMQLLQATFAVLDANRKVVAAESELKAIEEMSSSAPAAEMGLEQLNRDQLVLKENFEQLLRRRESARMRTAADLSTGAEQFRIIVAPSIPDEPAGPDRRTYLLLGALFAVASGAGLAYALGLLRGTFVSAAEAEAALGLPVIARLENRHGMLSSVSKSADAMALLAGVGGIFIGAYILSAATDLLSPLRTEIYRLFEGGIGAFIAQLF
jgi:polysaccharide chain length determinant protein (PEP-CTERM system associated)